MTLEEGLFSFLNARAELQALTFASGAFFDGTNCRIYPGTIAEDALFPALAYTAIGGTRSLTMSGRQGVRSARIQFTALSTVYSENATLIETLLSFLDGFSGSFAGGAAVEQARALGEPVDQYIGEARLYVRHCDFEIVYQV